MSVGLQFHELRSRSKISSLFLSPENEPFWTRIEPVSIPGLISVAGVEEVGLCSVF